VTILLMGAGAIAAALGTRLSALTFAAAAALGALGDQPALATWTTALAAGWVLLGPASVRPIALPALGAAAALGAAGSGNASVVLGLWVVATAAAARSEASGPDGRRWGLTLCASDLFLVAAVATTLGRGFEGWPGNSGTLGAVLLLAGAAARLPLAAGLTDTGSLAGLLVVRAQVAALVVFGVAASGTGVRQGVVVASAAAFALGPLARRPASADVTQELALFAMAVASSRLGWGPPGWEWGALAAGTLIHHLRFMVERGRGVSTGVLLHRSVGLGLPFLPVVLAQVEGSFEIRGPLAVAVLLGAVGGIAGRMQMPLRAVVAGSPADAVRGWAVAGAAAAAGMWAPFLSLPRPPAGVAIAWPPAWAVLVVLAVAAAGSQVPALVSGVPREVPALRWGVVTERFRWLDRYPGEKVLYAAVGLLAAAAAAAWVVGAARGFL
jgi:hypothetical protein